MNTYLLKPESFFPSLEIQNNDKMMELLGLQDSRKLRILFKRSGIENKYSLYDFEENNLNENLPDICWGAIDQLIANTGLNVEDIDVIITCNNAMDQQLPGLSSRLFEKLPLDNSILNFPIHGLGCGAFINAINLSQYLLKNDDINNILVVCAEAQTLYYPQHNDPENDSHMMAITLFSDGASATVLTKNSNLGKEKVEILDVETATFFSNSMTVVDNYAHMDDMLLENVSPYIYELITKLLEKNNLDSSQVKHWVMHSGGKKILQGMKKLFQLSDTQMLPSVQAYQEYGNLSCASVPTALNKLFTLSEEEYVVESGDLGIILGFGAGFFLGASLVRYN